MGPYPSEIVDDPQFEQFVSHICIYPAMYVHPLTFGAVCAYINGFNAGRGGGPLLGLREWLIVRNNDGNTFAWSALAVRLLGRSDSADRPLSDDELIEGVGRLLAEYFAFQRANGITKVFFDYANWLRRKRWYNGPLRDKPKP